MAAFDRGALKRWNGSSWETDGPTGSFDKSFDASFEGGSIIGILKHWTGSAWQNALLKSFDGSNWI